MCATRLGGLTMVKAPLSDLLHSTVLTLLHHQIDGVPQGWQLSQGDPGCA